ncbi:MAG: biotin/lipoyl-containing protein, partial [Verrucomicrobiota bacterium]|nr:biotin/lipoyl-containing protein [Verrucomicrobiota bacterium]
MAIEIHLPDIGTDSAEVTEVLVNIGDRIEIDTPLISVEGDKAAMEIPSPKCGTITEIKIAVGDSVSTGTLVLMIEPDKSDSTTSNDSTNQEEKKLEETVITSKKIPLPDVGSDEVTVTEIHVAVGDEIEIEKPIISVEGDKAAMEIPSPYSGKIIEINVAVGDSIGTGTTVSVMEITELPNKKKTKLITPSTPSKKQ